MAAGRSRAQLLLTTALAGLCGVLAAAPARAQTPPAIGSGMLPTGMRVVAGQANQSVRGNTLQVLQSSGRAALDWSSFDIGSRATVRFQDPSAQAMTLNRVTGPDASVIAGRLTSNGQIVLINQSGVVFMPGAVVDAQSVVVSAAGITEQGMRQGVATGHFVLDQPARPGARIVNQGHISVRGAGLAALVAPQVANHGRINAAFGTVSLDGVSSNVVDLYGDGLLSIDVSRQTVQGAGGQAALVTNDGVIAAQGGRITLSTAAVDGIVTNLVTAGGVISADGSDRRSGTVLIDAAGGSAVVSGRITARGMGDRRSVGGQVAVQATGQVVLAAGSRIDASGRGGGGTVAIGTTLARAHGGVGTPAAAAQLVSIAPGADVAADALGAGRGGQITVLSTDSTVMAGNLSARGGAMLGDGGNVEVSGFQGLSLLGGVEVGAARGRAGALTLDPGNITIDTGGAAGFSPPGTLTVGSTDPDAVISPATLQGFDGDIHLIADQNIVVNASFDLTLGHSLTMQATNGSILVNHAFANSAGSISMTAGQAITLVAGAGISAQGANGFIAMTAGGAISLGAGLTAGASINLAQAASVTQSGGAIQSPSLFSSGSITGPVSLQSGTNNVGALGTFSVSGGGFALSDAAAVLTVAQKVGVSGGALTLSNSGPVTLQAPLVADGVVSVSAGGALTQLAGAPITSNASAIALSSGGVLTLNDNLTTPASGAGSVNLEQATGVVQNAGSITTAALFSSLGANRAGTITGAVGLTSNGNAIGALGTFVVSGGGFALSDTVSTLTVAQAVGVTGGGLTLNNPAGAVILQAAVSADGFVGILAGGALTQQAGASITSTGSGISLNAGGIITLGADVSAIAAGAGSVDLAQATGVAQTGGGIFTPLLFSGSGIAGGVSLPDANAIDQLGGFSAQGRFVLVDAAPALTLLGSLSVSAVGNTSVASLLAPRLVFAQNGDSGSGFVSAATVELAPLAGGAVTLGVDSGSGFAITDTTLQSISATLLRIGAANGSTTASTVTVAAPFGVSGPVTLPTLELDSSISDTINAALIANALVLGGSGFVTQSLSGAATVNAGTLSTAGLLGGALDLPRADNVIPTLGTIVTAGGNVDIATSGALSVSGDVSTAGQTNTGGLTLDAAGGDITLASSVSVGALSVTTGGGGNVVQDPGAILAAASIAGSVAGRVALDDANSATTTLGPLTAASVSLTTTGPLTTSGAVAAGSVTLSSGGSMSIDSTITAASFDLSAATLVEDPVAGALLGVQLPGGPFQGILTSTGGGVNGDASLLGANRLTVVQGFRVGGALSLLNTQSVTIEAGVGGGALTSLHVSGGGSIEIDQPIVFSAPGGTLDLRADGVAIQQGASSDVATNGSQPVTIELIAVAPDSARPMLLGGAQAAAGALTLTDSTLGAMKANVLELGAIDAQPGAVASSLLVVNIAQINASHTAVLQLETSGSLSETLEAGGVLDADILTGTVTGGDLTLTDAGNTIGTLGALTVSGSAALLDSGAPTLTLTGAFSVGAGGTLALAANGLSLAGGTLAASGGTVRIGPALVAATVTVGAGTGGGIAPGDLSAITAATLQLGNSGIAGTQVASSVLLAGNATFAGSLILDAAGVGVSQNGGTLSAGTLAGLVTGGGFFVAGSTGNVIGTLGDIIADGIGIIDAQGVTVSGAVASNGTLGLTATGISLTGTGLLSATAGIGLNTDALSVGATAAVTANGGTVTIAPDAGLSLNVGPVAGGIDLTRVFAGTIELLTGSLGSITFSGAVVPGAATLAVNTPGSVSEAAGASLTVGTLSGNAGSVLLDGGNAIGALASFSVTSGDLSLNDAGLTVAGAIAAANPGAAQAVTLDAPSLLLAPGSQFSFAAAGGALVLESDQITGAINAIVPGGRVAIEPQTATAQVFTPTGNIVADTLELGGNLHNPRATSLTLGGFSFGGSSLILDTTGLLSQTAAISASAATLSGTADSVSLTLANALAALGNFSTTTGSFALTDVQALSVTGTVSAGAQTVTLDDLSAAPTGFGITLAAGSRVQGGSVALDSSGGNLGVTQDAAGIVSGALDGAVTGDLALSGTGNSIAAIGGLSVTGSLLLSDTVGLTEDSTGILNAGVLSGTFAGDVRLLGAANVVGALGNISAGGTLVLVDGNPTLAGTVQAEQISLLVNGIAYQSGALIATGIPPAGGGAAPNFATSGTVEIAPRDPGTLALGAGINGGPFVAAGVLANVDAALLVLGEADGRETATGIAVEAPVAVSPQVGTVELLAAGPGLVSEAPGATFGLSGTLTGTTGAVSLPGANSVPSLGTYTVTGGGAFDLGDSGALGIVGDVSAADITLDAGGSLTLGSPTAAGNLVAPGGTVDLTANGASEVSGIIVAAVLDSSGAPAGDVVLAQANQVGSLGPWNGSGALTLVDANGEGGVPVLTVAGPVGVSALTLIAESIVLDGAITATGAADLSTTSGGVTQTGGTLSAGLLTSGLGVQGGSVVLGAGGNAVLSLGPFAVSGAGFTLTDASPLHVTGAVSAGAILLTVPAGLTVNAPVNAPLVTVRGGGLAIGQGGVLGQSGGVVDVVASGATETGNGLIHAALLLSGGGPSGAFVLGGANQVTALGAFQMAGGGSLLLADAVPLTVAGPVTADAVTLSAPAIALAGLVAANLVDLSASGGGVVETTGSITAGLLSSSGGIAGGATLDSAGNAVAALGNIAVGSGDFDFAQPGSLAVAGVVAAANVALRIGGALQIAGAGRLQAGGTVDLSANGASEAATGSILAGVLDSTRGAAGQLVLDGANQVGALGQFADPTGGLSLADGQTLAVIGPVTAGSLALIAPSLTLNGVVIGGVVDLATTAGPLTQTGGLLAAATLTSLRGVAGPVSLTGPNQVAALGQFSAQGGVTLADARDLAIAGAVAAPAGLRLTVAGGLSEGTQGSIVTSLLSGQAAAAQLTQGGNLIGALQFSTPGSGFALADQQSLIVDALSGAGASLTVAGDLILAGPVSEAGAVVTVAATGAVSQVGGMLAAGVLQGNAAAMALPDGNAVAVLGDIIAPGGFTLADGSALAIAGVVRAGVFDLSVASGGITEPGGSLIGGRLVSARGIVGNTLLTGTNQLAAVGPLADGGRFELADTQALAVGGVSATTLDLSTSAGGITQTAPIAVGTIASSFGIVGGVQFAAPGNVIGVLGPMAVSGGNLALATIGNLAVVGPVTAPNATLAAAGAIVQGGDVVVPGTLSVTSGNVYQRLGGALAVGTLTGRAVSRADFGAGAAVGTLAAFSVNDQGDGFPRATATSTFRLADATALTLAGPLDADYIALTATGTLVWSGTITTLGLPRFQQDFPTLTDPGTYLSVLPGPGGSAQILQTGVANVVTQDGAISTVRLQLPPVGGLIDFGNLNAPTTDLLLFTGAGQAVGRIDVGDLLVSGRLGGTSLTGSVAGLLGAAAARQSDLAPFLDANYRINSCPIRSVNCILLPIETVPQDNPLRDLAIGQARDDQDDIDVLLPNVAEQDY